MCPIEFVLPQILKQELGSINDGVFYDLGSGLGRMTLQVGWSHGQRHVGDNNSLRYLGVRVVHQLCTEPAISVDWQMFP